MEKLKRNSGITLTMLTISVVVMLIIASILTYVSMNNENLMVNTEHTKFKETVTDLEAKVKQKIILKQEMAGKEDITLTEDEQQEILGEYYPDKFVVKDQDLYYKTTGNFSDDEKEILKELEITATNNWKKQ